MFKGSGAHCLPLLDMAEQQAALAHGIKPTESGAPCMVADLHRMNEAALTTVPEGFTIEEVAHRRLT
jgi:hypothetical protein